MPKQTLESLFVDRQIDLMRYSAGEIKAVIARIDKLEKKLKAELLSANIERAREIKTLISLIDNTVKDFYAGIAQSTSEPQSELFEIEKTATAQMVGKASGQAITLQVAEASFVDMMMGAPLADWWDAQSHDVRFKLRSAVNRMVTDGRTAQQATADFMDVFNGSRRNAKSLILTAHSAVTAQARQAMYDANSDIVQGVYQLSTLDSRTSTICRVRDGLKWDKDKQPIGHNQEFKQPPLHYRCRSVILPLIEGMTHSTRASENGQVPANLTYEQWLKHKSQSEQDEVLGKGKAQMWRDGVITFSDMVDQTGREISLQDLKDRFK